VTECCSIATDFAFIGVASRLASLFFLAFSWLAIAVTVLVFAFLSKSVVVVSLDGEALLAFKAALRDPTRILHSWKGSDPNPYLWNGVTCNTALKVQHLLLQDTQLLGPILGPGVAQPHRAPHSRPLAEQFLWVNGEAFVSRGAFRMALDLCMSSPFPKGIHLHIK
jgi:hypothetical protein